MSYMFSNARLFSADISKWDVSNVHDMSGMFHGAKSFNGDISKWEVSRVSKMDNMFRGASLFTRKLCGAAWVHSNARKTDMFAGSSGSISRTVCPRSSARQASSSSSSSDGLVAAVIGASGAVGKEVISHLVDRDRWAKVIVFNRRNMEYKSSKIDQHVVDMEPAELKQACAANFEKVDVLFITMGVGAPSKVSEDVLRKVDLTDLTDSD